MNKLPTLQDWVWVEAMLVQALVGVISRNIRRITLSFKDEKWSVIAILEKDDGEDREEIADVIDETAVYLEDIKNIISQAAYTKIECHIEISHDVLKPSQDENTRVIFQRKEMPNALPV